MEKYLVNEAIDEKPEYEAYPTFYHKYVDAISEGNILHVLEDQLHALNGMLGALDDRQWGYRYDEGKWSVKEVLGHLIDAERVFAFRAAAFARGDQNELPGFDENKYVEESRLAEGTPAALLEQFNHLRKANIFLFATFTDAILSRTGVSNGKPISVRAIIFITAGHLQHHMNILKERYGR